jgi:hypothetical protein
MSTAARGRCPIVTYPRFEFGPLASSSSSGACATLHTASIKSRKARASHSILSIGSLQYWDVTYAAWRSFTPNPAIVRAGVAMIARSIGSRRANIASTSLVPAS